MDDIYGVLAATGIPTYPGAWRPAREGDTPPPELITYTYARAPGQSSDNVVNEIDVYAYVTLWAKDPTAGTATVRAAAKAAGWGMVDERGGVYDPDGKCYRTSWTFSGWCHE